ncbi:proton-associated sugar transporter A [Ooceraea biroi]|uniref:Membrane-associated transporter protein n=1 Tax=Ooceraea biroi TaxID=2015173 RepID=A0A026WEV7_OOCBI|nr:proton-associated sugar transporter A [Ooceraea biroi]XP_011337897.1 proton-associated sugar transporter A [Ooceraea biroi]XP_011337898.1 proton-associated sugar transporter A [Ooceraea biroi]XP_011337899.1 proton-associated sugar transporter A [Ooceraea biroi]XP_011337900.1 proton-associated sugar transporter A [Ooceraea biroi]XP_011337901.1 proton-associated sugar transporter A [Ooceraea biroi]XP_011337902.1 proton-associated sugar transporter A [Ooceraea biroi]XP_011337903.1 proton-ass
MVDKLHDYEGLAGRIHGVRDAIKERWDVWKEWKNGLNLDQGLDGLKQHLRKPPKLERTLEDYSHIYRRKTRAELIRVSAAVMGIEFSYAAETAFVSPTLLKIGVDHQHMTLVWALSPLVGFFVTPILGSMSDRCKLKHGRRRPFILLLALGVFIGLILVPNGEHIGYAFGDKPSHTNETIPLGHRTTAKLEEAAESVERAFSHSWGIFFTILGTVLLDFDADACQSPARTYLLDVTIPEDHTRGLSTFTIMAGLGGFMGYGLGGINWDVTSLGIMLGGHLHVTFTLITIIFVICVVCTITSFKEVPLEVLERDQYRKVDEPKASEEAGETDNKRDEREKIILDELKTYGALNGATQRGHETTSSKTEEFTLDPLLMQPFDQPEAQVSESNHVNYGLDDLEREVNPKATLKEYLLSIIYMPRSLRQVCLTNLFCWMAHVCYSLYFTDFVGEAVFGGNPRAPIDTDERELYEEGVRFGCWGMSMYSLSCACYSLIIERLIQRFRVRKVYIYGLLFYSVGMLLMGLTRHPVGVIIFSWTAGVMYSTLFTMPYLLVAHYHNSSTFALTTTGDAVSNGSVRGLGTDIAIVSSMVFLAQFLLSCCLGTIVSLSGSTAAVAYVASILAMCGAASATQIMYLDL